MKMQLASDKEVVVAQIKKNVTMAGPVAEALDALAARYRNDKGHGVIVSAGILMMLQLPESQVRQMVGRVVAAGYDDRAALELVESFTHSPVAGTIKPDDSEERTAANKEQTYAHKRKPEGPKGKGGK